MPLAQPPGSDERVSAPPINEVNMKFEEHDQDTAFLPERELNPAEAPEGVDRRAFMLLTAVAGAAAVMTGCAPQKQPENAAAAQTAAPAQPAEPGPVVPLSPDLDVVKKEKGPVMTTIDEFYKVGPGPSSSHTIGPMRITYNFYQRC